MNIGKWIGKIFAVIIIGALLVVLVGLLTQSLWNWLVPDLFGGPHITFYQALGLLLLSKLLFWGMGGGKGKWSGQGSHRWNRQWKERYSNLSPEDKERFKQKFKDKWCSWEAQPTKTTSVEHQQNFTEPKL